eukprot:4824056-Heterocapsa_arctica.AAC.1
MAQQGWDIRHDLHRLLVEPAGLGPAGQVHPLPPGPGPRPGDPPVRGRCGVYRGQAGADQGYRAGSPVRRPPRRPMEVVEVPGRPGRELGRIRGAVRLLLHRPLGVARSLAGRLAPGPGDGGHGGHRRDAEGPRPPLLRHGAPRLRPPLRGPSLRVGGRLRGAEERAGDVGSRGHLHVAGRPAERPDEDPRDPRARRLRGGRVPCGRQGGGQRGGAGRLGVGRWTPARGGPVVR